MVKKLVQKMVQKIVQSIFYPMPAPPVPVAFTTEYRGMFSLTEWYSFLPLWAFFYFSSFFYRGLSSASYFSMSKDFFINKELPHVNFVKCAM